MVSTTDNDRKAILPCVGNSKSDVFESLNECDNVDIGLLIQSPATDRLSVIDISLETLGVECCPDSPLKDYLKEVT